MAEQYKLKEVDQVEILTLSDNYIDLVSMDSNEIVTRAMPIKDLEVKGSVLAEHGYAALVRTTVGGETHELFFDFGLSDVATPYNVDALEV
ncbi:MAG: hypothetical protein ACOC78_03675, partial [Actinomycetota bacterium]